MRDSNVIEVTTIQDKWGLSVTGIQLERYLNINGSSKHFFFSISLFWSTDWVKKEKKNVTQMQKTCRKETFIYKQVNFFTLFQQNFACTCLSTWKST